MYYTLGMYIFLEDWGKCYQYLNKSIQYYEQNPSHQQDKINNYIGNIGGIMAVLQNLERK